MNADSAAIGWTSVISSNLVNDMHVGWSRNFSVGTQDSFGQNKASDFVPGAPTGPELAIRTSPAYRLPRGGSVAPPRLSTGRQVAKARACKARIAGSTPARCSNSSTPNHVIQLS